MDRLFLDANILFSAAYRPNAGLIRFWRLRNVLLCSSRYAVEEATINLEEESQRRRLARLTEKMQLFNEVPAELPSRWSLPDKDAPILLAAMSARATHLITGDFRHFGRYFGKPLEGILVLSPAMYLKGR